MGCHERRDVAAREGMAPRRQFIQIIPSAYKSLRPSSGCGADLLGDR